MNNDKYLSVSIINKYIKRKFDGDDNLQTVYLKGEISNCKVHTTGHIYLTIKDETSRINAVMFNQNASKLTFNPVDGTKVLITGRISVYEATGNYQIYIESMEEDGIGNLYIAFEKLKQKLQEEGLFKDIHKKEIPKFPKTIGVITASTGAAIKDIITTIKRRYPIAEILLFPSLVQGDNAKDDLVKNIKKSASYDLDVLIIGRGGGSIEDLWPFNEEIVARAIFECTTPVISAVGHEIDYTIADFVADLRAPTPTAAAEMAVPNLIDLKKYINQINIRLNENILKKIHFQKLVLDGYKNSYVMKNPTLLIEAKLQKIDTYLEKLNVNMITKIDNVKTDLFNLTEKLEILNPLNTLKRGFSVTYKDEKPIKSIKNIKVDDQINVKLEDGNIIAIVKEII